MRRTAALLLMPLLLACAAPLAAQPETNPHTSPDTKFSLQQVMSAPFVSDLSAAPAGGRVAWVANVKGARNIWVAHPGTHEPAQQITSYSEDDGEEISDLAWTADGGWIAYTRGGDAEWPDDASPNPAHLTSGVKQEVWLISAAGGTPRDVGEGHGAAISAAGETIAYLQHGQIWTASLKDVSVKPQPLMQMRGTQRDLRWSPDGASLAFVSDRGDHSFIAVFDFAQRELRFLDPGTTKDGEPVWSPDGRQIAFLRRPSMPELSLRWLREADEPWSIRMVARDGTGAREVWRAQRGRGSLFHGVAAESELAWSADGRFVFPWERDGWVHLYSVPVAKQGEATLLTPGAFEVDHVAFGADRRRIVYSSNQYGSDPHDADRRHLWSVSPDGGGPQQLTHGDGIETAPVIASDGAVAMVRMDAHVPARAAVLEAGGPRDLAPQTIPASYPAAKLIVPQQVLFRAADGLEIHGQLFVPEDGNAKHAAVVFFHGGSRRQMLLGFNPMGYYSNAYAMNQYLASRGYVVLSVNYRSGVGYGLEFRQALHYGAAGASEYNDVVGAARYLESRADVDAKRIGAWGGSYGGYLTALALARGSDMYAAGVDLHGVHDWSLELDLWKPTSDFTVDQAAVSRLAWQSSPMASLDTWRSPVLLMQGDDDRNVLFAQTVRLAHELRARGVPVEEHVFPDEVHAFLLYRDWMTAYTLAADFLDRRLRDKPQ
jgi:dipeptidyl aminopeptidase/acylaminoacyl peptidase